MWVAYRWSLERLPKPTEASRVLERQVLDCRRTALAIFVYNMSGHQMNTRVLRRGLHVGENLRWRPLMLTNGSGAPANQAHRVPLRILSTHRGICSAHWLTRPGHYWRQQSKELRCLWWEKPVPTLEKPETHSSTPPPSTPCNRSHTPGTFLPPCVSAGPDGFS